MAKSKQEVIDIITGAEGEGPESIYQALVDGGCIEEEAPETEEEPEDDKTVPKGDELDPFELKPEDSQKDARGKAAGFAAKAMGFGK